MSKAIVLFAVGIVIVVVVFYAIPMMTVYGQIGTSIQLATGS